MNKYDDLHDDDSMFIVIMKAMSSVFVYAAIIGLILLTSILVNPVIK